MFNDNLFEAILFDFNVDQNNLIQSSRDSINDFDKFYPTNMKSHIIQQKINHY